MIQKSPLFLGLTGLTLALTGTSFATRGSPSEPAQSQRPAGPTASLVFGDVDGDGLEDVLAIDGAGHTRLFRNLGAGRFEDVTAASRLVELDGASCALFADLDGDGRLDLFTGSSEQRLWRNLGHAGFEPMASGIEHDLVDLGAVAVDHDQDGRLDLLIHTEAGDLVYRNLGQGRFERLDLPLGDAPSAPGDWIAPQLLEAVEPAEASLVFPAAEAPRATDTRTPAQRRLGRWAQGRAAAGWIAAPGPSSSSAPRMGINFDARYVNDNGNEVDSADIVDGSLTGADVSTSSGDVTFSGATVTASRGVFGVDSSASGNGTTLSGGIYNQASGNYSTVSGGFMNSTSMDASTVSGGARNTASAFNSTVSGGVLNTASERHSTVSGGWSNSASGIYSTVSGGGHGTASGSGTTVSGGRDQTASGIGSTVSGGRSNTASGYYSTVSGGLGNRATGDFSFAAGRTARANHSGSFVWGDSVDGIKSSSANNQFNVYSEGGMRVFTVDRSISSMELTTGGRVGIGTATPQGGLSVFAQKTTGTPTEQGVHMGREGGGYANSTVIEIVSASTGLPAIDFNALGSGQADFGARLYWDRPSDTLFVTGANLCATVACPSSERFKENVTPLMGALEAVLELEGVRFDWRPEEAEKRGFTHDFGFIAEQVQEVIPEVVLADEDGLVIGMDYARLSAFLVEAMKEQQRTIGEQQRAFEAQQREIDALRSRASELEQLRSEIELLKTSLAALAAR